MDFPIHQFSPTDFPLKLREIPQQPKQLYVRGILPPRGTLSLAVVGSRDYTNYGKQVTEFLISGLHGYPVSIISGLALGIDSIAHETALEAGLYTLAVPGSGIDNSVIHPRRHLTLAQRILEAGGGLLSEYEPTFRATPWSFPARNRIMVGLSDAVLVIEAKEKSGTLITARLAAEYNRDLLIVPGNIFSENSKGAHQFLKLGATPITASGDILDALGIQREATNEEGGAPSLSPELRHIYELLTEPKDRDTVIRESGFFVQEANVYLMELELRGLIRDNHGTIYKS